MAFLASAAADVLFDALVLLALVTIPILLLRALMASICPLRGPKSNPMIVAEAGPQQQGDPENDTQELAREVQSLRKQVGALCTEKDKLEQRVAELQRLAIAPQAPIYFTVQGECWHLDHSCASSRTKNAVVAKRACRMCVGR